MDLFDIHGGFDAIVASTRVRLARNIKGYCYGKQSPEMLAQLTDKVWQVIQNAPALADAFTKIQIIPDSPKALQLVEHHKISPELAAQGGFLITSNNGAASIMLGEEDHLRLQVVGSGLAVNECLTEALRLAQLLESQIPMDYDEKLGYLTACPSNIGTGLRVSVMLHLPALSANVQQLIRWAAQQGCTIRGTFGEGSRAQGDFYQLSNQVTLGMSNQGLADTLTNVAAKVIEAEQQARQSALSQDSLRVKDQICRAVGILSTARLIDTNEALSCLSQVLMGLQLELLTGIAPREIYDLLPQIYPATLQAQADHPLSASQRDAARAQLLRTHIKPQIQPQA